ncbi:MAG: hypothetical protein LBO67_05085 [Spirochaetaceae bacterium]|jgi:hypothetical protein|nr:hypothetical protein [Spirochaetaceae bacterium]
MGKKVLIVSDGTASTQIMVQRLVNSLTGAAVTIRSAADFLATDLLAAEGYFLGCESPYPVSFASFERVLGHINLVGRPCGIFSPVQEKALEYLARIVFDSELALYPVPFFGDSAEDIAQWVNSVLAYNGSGTVLREV